MGISTDAILVYGIDLGDEFNGALGPLLEDRWQDLDAAEKATGCTLVWHCSGECPMYILGITAVGVKARRGHPEHVTSLRVKPGAAAAIRRFAKALGIPVAGRKPKWLLCSWWSC